MNKIIIPAHRLGRAKIFGHFYRQKFVQNERTNEDGEIQPNEDKLLPFDEIIWGDRDLVLEEDLLRFLLSYGDAWSDNFSSMKNLFLQLRSLSIVTKNALLWKPDIVLFFRPDLHYHDDFTKVLNNLLERTDSAIALPNWQSWGGYNDRFALVRGTKAAEAYGTRINRALEYCKSGPHPLHSEALVAFALQNHKVIKISNRATRIRVGGVQQSEIFSGPLIEKIHMFYWSRLARTKLGSSVNYIRSMLSR